jgi:hypothetical protein
MKPLNKKYHWHFRVATKYGKGDRWLEETYGNATFEELKTYIKNYLPKGDGLRRVDLRTLTILGKTEEY